MHQRKEKRNVGLETTLNSQNAACLLDKQTISGPHFLEQQKLPSFLLISHTVCIPVEIELHMNLRTACPKAIPRKVAIAMPKMPARMPGTTRELHPLAVAIPQAVVGPPTFAFDAISNDLRSKRSNFPKPRMIARWTAIWTRENKKMLGAVVITLLMLPFAPTTVKNT